METARIANFFHPKHGSTRSKKPDRCILDTINIPQDWREFLEALRSENTKFLLIGAHAVAYHAEARLTQDIDIFVETTLDNVKRLHRALTTFGFGDIVESADQLSAPNRVFMLGRKPWRIDILTSIDGVGFEEAWAGRVETSFHGIPISVIGRTELIKNKKASGRKKDLVDIAILEEE